MPDPAERPFAENLDAVLRERAAPLTHQEILAGWPDDADRPSASTLYHWLNRAAAAGRVRRDGRGTKVSPWRYRRPPAAPAAADLFELPPLPGWAG